MPQHFRIPVFFRPEVVADSGAYSPSAAKPAQVVDDWRRHRLPIELRSFELADRAALLRAHDARYVDGVLAGKIRNGFGNTREDVTASLPFTSGAMLAAARAAMDNGRVACAPVSGFHHAGYDSGGGFCTFNGLMVAAASLQTERPGIRVGILDLDQHFGDGTEDIIARIDARYVRHYTSGAHGLRAADAPRFLRDLATLVGSFQDCGVLLYQAGADAHVDDPLGGWMSSEQLAERDRIVFETCARIGLPVAWNLAGGYRRDAAGSIEPVLAVHRATMQACAAVFR